MLGLFGVTLSKRRAEKKIKETFIKKQIISSSFGVDEPRVNAVVGFFPRPREPSAAESSPSGPHPSPRRPARAGRWLEPLLAIFSKGGWSLSSLSLVNLG